MDCNSKHTLSQQGEQVQTENPIKMETTILENGAVQNTIQTATEQEQQPSLEEPHKVEDNTITITKTEYDNLKRENSNLSSHVKSLQDKLRHADFRFDRVNAALIQVMSRINEDRLSIRLT